MSKWRREGKRKVSTTSSSRLKIKLILLKKLRSNPSVLVYSHLILVLAAAFNERFSFHNFMTKWNHLMFNEHDSTCKRLNMKLSGYNFLSTRLKLRASTKQAKKIDKNKNLIILWVFTFLIANTLGKRQYQYRCASNDLYSHTIRPENFSNRNIAVIKRKRLSVKVA